jgi:hypothetical protein
MFTSNKRKLLGLAGLAAGLLPLGAAFAAVGGGYEAPQLPRCEIRVGHEDGGVVLEGFVLAGAPMSGTYEMRISQSSGGNSSDITQGGEFTVDAGSSEPLGSVSLSGGTYTARLSVEWDGGTIDCVVRAGGGKRVDLF